MAADTVEGQWYDVRVVMAGTSIEVWRTERGLNNWASILTVDLPTDHSQDELLSGTRLQFT
mgnify:CR=1 FL=1